jgi:starvation-inducible DNA-binding protein
MNELTISMKKLLANVFFFYYKAHAFHWNVEGPLFKQYHDFFGDIYSDVHASVDGIAEQIRVLDEYAPTGISELYQAKTIQESNIVGNDPVRMLSELYIDNKELSANLLEAFGLANALNNQGLADYLAGRQDAHAKLDWMIKSHLK